MQKLNTLINQGFNLNDLKRWPWVKLDVEERKWVKPPSTLFVVWVDQSGKPVYLYNAPGVHPWLVHDANGQVISSVTPYKSNMELTIE